MRGDTRADNKGMEKIKQLIANRIYALESLGSPYLHVLEPMPFDEEGENNLVPMWKAVEEIVQHGNYNDLCVCLESLDILG